MATPRGNKWQGRFKPPGGKYYRYSFPTQAQAEAWEEKARAAFRADEPIPVPGDVDMERPTLRGLYDQYGQVIWPNALESNLQSSLRAVEGILPLGIRVHEISQKHVMDMLAAMVRKGNKPSTINTRLSFLRQCMQYAKRLGIVEHELEYPVQKVGNNARLRFLTEEEETKIIHLLEHWGMGEVSRLVGALIDTGCRPGELIHGEGKNAPINWSEVSVSAGGTAPDVNDPKTGTAKAVISLMRTKTGKYRVIPLTERARQAFLASKEAGDKRPFGDMTTRAFADTFTTATGHLGLEDVVVYTLRHTCASRLVQRGADLRRVMQWMGHTNINTTLRYAKLTPTDIFELEELL